MVLYFRPKIFPKPTRLAINSHSPLCQSTTITRAFSKPNGLAVFGSTRSFSALCLHALIDLRKGTACFSDEKNPLHYKSASLTRFCIEYMRNKNKNMEPEDRKMAGSETSFAMKEKLWNQLMEIQKQDMEAVEAEKTKLENEKKAMTKIKADPSDIISINAGGKLTIQAHRDTLCLVEGSTFANMFSGRWEDSFVRDETGNVFLDHDPEMIESIVNHLRLKKIEDPSDPIGPPTISDKKEKSFKSLLKYFGLKEFFYPFWGLPLDLRASLPFSSLIGFESLDKGQYRIRYTGDQCHARLVFSPALVGTQSYFWKCTIEAFPEDGWLFLGLVGTRNPSNPSYEDTTSSGWSSNCVQWEQGCDLTDHWLGFGQGDVLYFCLKDNLLTMSVPSKDETLVVSDIPNDPFIHFNFYDKTTVKLEALTEEEIRTVGWS